MGRRFAKKSSKKQKLYKMKGCSKTRKHYLGGSNLAYTGKQTSFLPNPNLAYTGSGGSLNTNGVNPALPNTGPVYTGQPTVFNSPQQSGGGCGCGLMKGGGMCHACASGMTGGSHRIGCRCSDCKMGGSMKEEMKGGNAGIPYPNGLVGSSWKSDINTWPGVNGVPGDSNHYPMNNYNTDISRQMKDVGANAPFKGGRRRRSRKQKGGTLSNFMGQDLINLGRQFQFGVGSAYNALAGYSAPVNPLPWKDQFPARVPFNPATV